MIFELHRPSFPLSLFVQHMWLYEGYCPDHTMERLLPDGTMELVIDLYEQPKRLFNRERFDQFQTFKKSWISGKHTRYIVIEAAPESSMMGVHFKPAGTYPFLRLPVSELTNQVVGADLVWGRSVRFVRDELIEAPTPAAKFAILERFLMERCGGVLKPNRSVDCALALLMRSPHGMAIRDLAAGIGITQKHLISQFDKFVGLKPKLFARVCKFQGVLKTVERGKKIDWAHTAASCGYYDQAHFIKEFQSFSGMNPSRYIVERMEQDPNYVPIRNS